MRVRPDAGSKRGWIHGPELTSYSEYPCGEPLRTSSEVAARFSAIQRPDGHAQSRHGLHARVMDNGKRVCSSDRTIRSLLVENNGLVSDGPGPDSFRHPP